MPYVQLSQIRMHYYERGQGPETVVLVHGFQLSARVWQLVQDALPPDRYRTIAPNMRGAGETDAPADEAAFSIPAFAADVAELVDALGLQRFTLVGHSMGGMTVAKLAVDHPERVSGLLLLDPSDPDGRQASSPAETDRLVDERMAARRHQGTHGLRIDGADPGGDSDPRAALRRQLAEDARSAPERRLRGTLRSTFALRLGEQVARLPMPVLLACGDADETIPIAQLLHTWAQYPKGTGLHVWHGVGHSPNVEIPERFAALLRQFVEATVPARREGREALNSR